MTLNACLKVKVGYSVFDSICDILASKSRQL